LEENLEDKGRESITGRILLVHWNIAEAEEHAAQLQLDGWEVEIESEDGRRGYRRIKSDLRDAVVIYLSRLPFHGRELGRSLREVKATRGLPIVFVDGMQEAVEEARNKVPDALFARAGQSSGTP
jgi:DNA-binding response OmpR family regulator